MWLSKLTRKAAVFSNAARNSHWRRSLTAIDIPRTARPSLVRVNDSISHRNIVGPRARKIVKSPARSVLQPGTSLTDSSFKAILSPFKSPKDLRYCGVKRDGGDATLSPSPRPVKRRRMPTNLVLNYEEYQQQLAVRSRLLTIQTRNANRPSWLVAEPVKKAEICGTAIFPTTFTIVAAPSRLDLLVPVLEAVSLEDEIPNLSDSSYQAAVDRNVEVAGQEEKDADPVMPSHNPSRDQSFDASPPTVVAEPVQMPALQSVPTSKKACQPAGRKVTQACPFNLGEQIDPALLEAIKAPVPTTVRPTVSQHPPTPPASPLLREDNSVHDGRVRIDGHRGQSRCTSKKAQPIRKVEHTSSDTPPSPPPSPPAAQSQLTQGTQFQVSSYLSSEELQRITAPQPPPQLPVATQSEAVIQPLSTERPVPEQSIQTLSEALQTYSIQPTEETTSVSEAADKKSRKSNDKSKSTASTKKDKDRKSKQKSSATPAPTGVSKSTARKNDTRNSTQSAKPTPKVLEKCVSTFEHFSEETKEKLEWLKRYWASKSKVTDINKMTLADMTGASSQPSKQLEKLKTVEDITNAQNAGMEEIIQKQLDRDAAKREYQAKMEALGVN